LSAFRSAVEVIHIRQDDTWRRGAKKESEGSPRLQGTGGKVRGQALVRRVMPLTAKLCRPCGMVAYILTLNARQCGHRSCPERRRNRFFSVVWRYYSSGYRWKNCSKLKPRDFTST
jgi:hypothetical protein